MVRLPGSSLESPTDRERALRAPSAELPSLLAVPGERAVKRNLRAIQSILLRF